MTLLRSNTHGCELIIVLVIDTTKTNINNKKLQQIKNK